MRTSNMYQLIKFSLCALACAVLLSGVSVAEENKDTDSKKEKVKLTKAEKAAQKRLNRIWKTQTPVEGFASVEMFEAMKSGEIEVLIKTKDAAEANIMVTNKTDKPLAIAMPAAFAAVPVMRQALGGGGGGGFGGGQGGGRGGGQQGGGGGQGTGGGMGGGQGGGGFGGGGRGGGGGGLGGGGGGGIFNIPPGRVGKIEVQTFCLEHGKPDPRPRMDYTVAPIETLSEDPAVHQLCRMLASGEIHQSVAQASAWHMANGLSWDELLVKNRIERMDGSYERYFHPQAVQMAYKVVQAAKLRVAEEAKIEKLKKKYEDEAYQAKKNAGAGE